MGFIPRQGKAGPGRENPISLGAYPAAGLKDAREKSPDARRALESRKDSSARRRQARPHHKDTFENIARERHEKQAPDWSEPQAAKVPRRMENNLFPYMSPIYEGGPTLYLIRLKAFPVSQHKKIFSINVFAHTVKKSATVVQAQEKFMIFRIRRGQCDFEKSIIQ